MKKLIQIFKPGKHTAMNGVTLDFTESILIASAAAYDPAIFRAPLVVGHPKTDAPAYGWVDKLEYSDALMNAMPVDVHPEFAELVNKKTYPKVSASFYTPDSPSNPVPGVYYLKHIGFLGGAAPAIKGLTDASFATDEAGVVEFTDWDQMTVVSLFRRLREYLIGKDGIDAANSILPSYEIEGLQMSAVREPEEKTNVLYTEPTPQIGETMTEEDKARFAKLEADNAALTTANLAFAENAKTQKLATIHAENLSFAESLVKAGKLLPATKDSTVALMDNLAAQETAIEFGEGETKANKTPLAITKTS